ncbi:MAG: hypothetical protein R3B82_18375 [Sandaracinaceae bacterium]
MPLSSLHLAGASTSGVTPDGRATCQQRYEARPGMEDPVCEADGDSVDAEITHAWIDGREQQTLDTPLTVERVRGCGRQRQPVRDRRSLARAAPSLALAAPTSSLALEGLEHTPCAREDVVLELSPGVEMVPRGPSLRFSTSRPEGRVRVLWRDRELLAFDVDSQVVEGECGGSAYTTGRVLSLELVCAGDRMLVIGGTWRPFHNSPCVALHVRPRDPGPRVPCVPDEETDGSPAWNTFHRRLVDLRSGAAEEVVFTRPDLRSR